MARSGAIEIPVAVDTGGVEKSIQNGLIDPIEDAEKALEKLGKTDAGRDIDKELDKAQDATEDLSKELDATRADLKKLGYAAKDAGDDTRDGMKRAKDGVEEVGREAESTAKEAAASFDGSAESIGDAFQEVAANAFAGFGPAGVVAGVAAAAGIGLAAAGFEATTEAQKLAEEAASEWANTYIEEGSKVLSQATIVAQGLDIITNKFSEAKTNAELWGVSVETAAAAMAGSPSAMDEVADSINGIRLEYEKLSQSEGAFDEWGNANGPLAAADNNAKKAEDSYKKLTDAMTTGAAQADTYSYFLRDLANSTEGATRTVDEFGDSVYALPDGTTVYVDAETGQATADVDAIEKKLYGVPKTTNATVVVGVDSSAFDRWWRNKPTSFSVGAVVRRGQIQYTD